MSHSRQAVSQVGGQETSSEEGNTPSEEEFNIAPLIPWKPVRWGYRLCRRPLEAFLGITGFRRRYASISSHLAKMPKEELTSHDFYHEVLRDFHINYEVNKKERAQIPHQGCLVVVANHPFGGIDGVVLADLITGIRPDYKSLSTYFLAGMKEMRSSMIAVDLFGGKGAQQMNMTAMKAALLWLKQGHCLSVFPSGTVSYFSWRNRQVLDPPWNPNMARLIRKQKAMVLPVFFEGRNSMLFQSLGQLHPLMRTLLLSHELLNKQGTTVKLRIGQPITASELNSFKDDQALIDYLRLKTYLLRDRKKRSGCWFRWPSASKNSGGDKQASPTPLVKPDAPDLIAEELAQLPKECLLHEQGRFSIFFAKAHSIPLSLREIGRLRETTFRSVGEGTGKAIDLDPFDRHYEHLFLWNKKTSEIVGAYRLGKVDEILTKYGKKGLYTNTLFKFKAPFLQWLEQKGGLELGRSFIRTEYQKKYMSLFLLWKGIALFVSYFPQYKLLFGPVSIPQNYDILSKELIVHFLRENCFDKSLLSRWIKAKRPPRDTVLRFQEKEALCTSVSNLEQISSLISEIEPDNKGIPVLLRHYLKLEGVLLSFHIDKHFNNSLDGLIMVDLTKVDPTRFENYVGTERRQAFYRYHGIILPDAASTPSSSSPSSSSKNGS